MINNQEETTLKGVIVKLAREISELKEKIEGIHTSQEKIETSMHDVTTVDNSGTAVQYMEADVVEKTIKENLNTQLVGSKVKVEAAIEDQSKELISMLVECGKNLVYMVINMMDSIEVLRPRKPLLKLDIHGDKKHFLVGFCLTALSIVVVAVVLIWAQLYRDSIEEQDYFWAHRAYQAALLMENEEPGILYDQAMSDLKKEPEATKQRIVALEKRSGTYHDHKQYLLSLIGQTRDIRVIDWEIYGGEGWFLYRYYDEETERSIHVWQDRKVEETTDKIVTNLATAQKYSKRKIWTVIKEAPTDVTN